MIIGVLYKANGDKFDGEWIDDNRGPGNFKLKIKEFTTMQIKIDMKEIGSVS